MESGVVSVAYALGVEGSLQVLGGVQNSHAAIPVTPPAFQFSVAARIMSKRGCPGSAESRVDRSHQVGEEFGGGPCGSRSSGVPCGSRSSSGAATKV
jgi:hypothetical protein